MQRVKATVEARYLVEPYCNTELTSTYKESERAFSEDSQKQSGTCANGVAFIRSIMQGEGVEDGAAANGSGTTQWTLEEEHGSASRVAQTGKNPVRAGEGTTPVR